MALLTGRLLHSPPPPSICFQVKGSDLFWTRWQRPLARANDLPASDARHTAGRPSSRRSSGRSTSERERGRARARLLRTKSVRVCPSYALAASDEGERERKESLKASCKERESPSPNASRNILTRPLSLPRPSNHLTTAPPPSQFFPHCDIHYPSAISSGSSCFEATRRRRRREPLASHYSPARTPEPFRFAIRTVPLFQESPRTGANFLVRILG